MHTIRLMFQGRPAYVNYNGDWSGMALVKWKDASGVWFEAKVPAILFPQMQSRLESLAEEFAAEGSPPPWAAELKRTYEHIVTSMCVVETLDGRYTVGWYDEMHSPAMDDPEHIGVLALMYHAACSAVKASPNVIRERGFLYWGTVEEAQAACQAARKTLEEGS